MGGGAKFAFFPFDDKVKKYVSTLTNQPFETVVPDNDANYVDEIEIDVSDIGFPIACPHKFDNVKPIEEVAGVKIDQALIGSCANGRFEDIELATKIIEGKKVHPYVRFFVEPASWGVYKKCLKAGFFEILIDAGVQVQEPGCWVCEAHGSVLTDNEVCITSTTRNFRGRKGSKNAEIYLGGPAAVTAAAITGEIVNPKKVFNDF